MNTMQVKFFSMNKFLLLHIFEKCSLLNVWVLVGVCICVCMHMWKIEILWHFLVSFTRDIEEISKFVYELGKT